MKLLQIFGLVIYFHYGASYIINKADKLISMNVPGNDYQHLTKVHHKRYSGIGPKHLVREASDLLNSYFKIGTLPLSDGSAAPVPPPSPFIDAGAGAGDDDAKNLAHTTTNAKLLNRKIQLFEMTPQMSSGYAAAPASPVEAINQPQPPAGRDKKHEQDAAATDVDAMPVKHPIIVVGRLRGATGLGPVGALDNDEWRKRRKMPAQSVNGVFSICNN